MPNAVVEIKIVDDGTNRRPRNVADDRDKLWELRRHCPAIGGYVAVLICQRKKDETLLQAIAEVEAELDSDLYCGPHQKAKLPKAGEWSWCFACGRVSDPP